jgi:5'/3'-nucleotidase
MRLSLTLALAAISCAPSVAGLNILLGNDDSWASANIREFYKALKAAGHRVLVGFALSNKQQIFTDNPTARGASS